MPPCVVLAQFRYTCLSISETPQKFGGAVATPAALPEPFRIALPRPFWGPDSLTVNYLFWGDQPAGWSL